MNKKTQQYLILAVILVAIGAIYFFFIRKPKTTTLPAIFTNATPTTTATQQGTFTPDSFKLDLKSLNDPRLQVMTAPVYPQVQKSELGEQDPFKGQ